MKDFVIANEKEIKDIHGNVLVIDDNLTTGSTLASFLMPTINSLGSDVTMSYIFTIFGKGLNRSDKILGVDYELTRHDKTKLRNESSVDDIIADMVSRLTLIAKANKDKEVSYNREGIIETLNEARELILTDERINILLQ